MPISFRCTACDRTLSIATRKAGTQVDCPKCGVKVLVPATAGVAVASNPAGPALEAMPLFERPDFEALLDPAAKAAAAKPASVNFELPKVELSKPPVMVAPPLPVAVPMPVPLPALAVAADDDVDVATVEGVIISRAKMTWIAVVIAVLLAASFAVGYFLGRATVPKQSAVMRCGDAL